MIGLDTNVIVRYITQDDPVQARKATRFIETKLSAVEPGFITLITLVEIAWVLESCYDQDTPKISNILQTLLTTRQLLIEKSDVAYLAMKRCTTAHGDFSDALIAVISEHAGCARVVTFDKKARSVGMELL